MPLREFDDRAIHARLPDGTEIIRYNRAGKWFAEKDDPLIPKQTLTIAEAVEMVQEVGTIIYTGVPGGRQFDSKVKAAAKARAESTEEE